MKLISLITLFILLSVSVTGLGLEWNNQYCKTDFDCENNYICITKYTDDNIFSLSSKSDVNVITAKQLGKEGKCARVYHQIDEDNKIYYSKYIGTQNIPDEIINEVVVCPVCEVCPVANNTVDIKYQDKIVYETNYLVVWILLTLFVSIMIGEYFFFKKKYKSKSDQFDRLKSFSPSFVKNSLKGKSMEEVRKMIKDSEGRGK